MNRREMAKLYTKMSPEMLSIIKAEDEIEEFLETVKEAIVLDREVKFPRRGIFEILTRKPRVVANPVTKEQMTIYPKKIIKFRASKKMK
ncbi:HU family DNA-binding protein [Fusobacterium ulcerans]|jgi:nucleoid DNA-binding protein|uniref:HU family DNA-binding protein n=1 Tax=Fusobacterium ulcerans TaxID=861 RepID=UPI000E4F9E2D|nr:HU family DNA-binding protein [Fusobacterium ulcerans]RGY62850.1 HU family DNA-binding protein [Fusobacterium ulcerans]